MTTTMVNLMGMIDFFFLKILPDTEALYVNQKTMMLDTACYNSSQIPYLPPVQNTRFCGYSLIAPKRGSTCIEILEDKIFTDWLDDRHTNLHLKWAGWLVDRPTH